MISVFSPNAKRHDIALWPVSTVRAMQQNGSDWGNSGRDADIAKAA
jgi:hypothetical protein